MERLFGGHFGPCTSLFSLIKVGKDSDAGTVSQLPVCYLQRPGFAPVRVTGTGTGQLPIAMSDEEARPPLNILSPKELTESDDERPQSAQKPDTSTALNADSDTTGVWSINFIFTMRNRRNFLKNKKVHCAS